MDWLQIFQKSNITNFREKIHKIAILLVLLNKDELIFLSHNRNWTQVVLLTGYTSGPTKLIIVLIVQKNMTTIW